MPNSRMFVIKPQNCVSERWLLFIGSKLPELSLFYAHFFFFLKIPSSRALIVLVTWPKADPKIYFSHRRPSLFAGEWEQRTTAARHLEAGPFIIHMACLSSDISNSGCFVNDLTCFWPWLFSLWKGNLNRAPKAGNTDDFHGQQHGTWEVTMETFKSNRRGLERGSISMKKYCSRQHYLLFLLFF